MISSMHVNPRPAHVRAYLPSIYLPGSLGRFRQYPRVTETPIPGAGHRAGKLVWGEQVLYLGGYGDINTHGGAYPYGRYGHVPLRGLGQSTPPQPWYTRTWVWLAAGGTVLLLGAGSYVALGKLKRNRRRRRRARRGTR